MALRHKLQIVSVVHYELDDSGWLVWDEDSPVEGPGDTLEEALANYRCSFLAHHGLVDAGKSDCVDFD